MPSKVLKPVFLTSETELLVASLPLSRAATHKPKCMHLVCVRPWILSQELEEYQKFKVILATYGF